MMLQCCYRTKTEEMVFNGMEANLEGGVWCPCCVLHDARPKVEDVPRLASHNCNGTATQA